MEFRKLVKKMLKTLSTGEIKTSVTRKTSSRNTSSEKRFISFFTLGRSKVPVTIIKSPRRRSSMTMKVDTDGIMVRTPLRATDTSIHDFLVLKKKRIAKKRDMMKKRRESLQQFKQGNKVPFMGKNYPLTITESDDSKRVHLVFCDDGFTIDLPRGLDEDIKQKRIDSALKRWYINRAEDFISKETLKLAQEWGLSVKGIYIKNYKAKYGQCAGKDVYFSYKIIQFPIEIIRHIILHELAHIKHKNHGKRFRTFLEKMDPQTKENVKWLKDHGVMLE